MYKTTIFKFNANNYILLEGNNLQKPEKKQRMELQNIKQYLLNMKTDNTIADDLRTIFR